MTSYPTPHIKATPSDFAKTVLMPGDPLRSKFIAENYLESPVLINNVRGVQGYTGTYKGEKVSVMASGMGIPSIAIYSTELYTVFGVENIIRVGTIGAMADGINLYDVIIGMGACTDSSFTENFSPTGTFAPIADYELMHTAIEEAKKAGVRYHVGNVLSSDIFYGENPDASRRWAKMGVLGVEMEAAGLYTVAKRYGKRALAVCTVSDHIFKGESCNADLRERAFTDMMEIALNTAIRME